MLGLISFLLMAIGIILLVLLCFDKIKRRMVCTKDRKEYWKEKFCPECGHKLVRRKDIDHHCHHCGGKVDISSRFCHNCGANHELVPVFKKVEQKV